MKFWVIYDDRKNVSSQVNAFVSVDRYGAIVFRQKTLRSLIRSTCKDKNWNFAAITDAAALTEALRAITSDGAARILWLPACFAPLGGADTVNQMERMLLVDGTCVGAGLSEIDFIAAFDSQATAVWTLVADHKQVESIDCYVDLKTAFLDVSDLSNLVDYLSGALGARHFNNVKRSAGNIIKFSQDKKKIKAEHDYFHLLPAAMKRWFVMPFDYVETEAGAAYTMERMMLLDMGQQWINGGMSVEEFRRFLKDIFRFIDERPKKSIGKEQARAHFNEAYIEKVRRRFAEFQALETYRFVDDLVRSSTGEISLAAIFERYYAAIAAYANSIEDSTCIGHGDACFSNILYDRRTRLLKLIDPKGAISEQQLFTDPLYDIAKLSHSIMGGYDFVSNGLYDITMGADCRLHLHTPESMYTDYARLFLEELVARDIDPRAVRLLEASLFLSMLPLHIDKPRNVLAFVLIALNILREVENNADV
ncbi:MAG: hypothetical protein V4805_07565 [Pseudomonadota bacterium]